MTAYQHRPHPREPELLTPPPNNDGRNALLWACGTVLAIAAVVGIWELAVLAMEWGN